MRVRRSYVTVMIIIPAIVPMTIAGVIIVKPVMSPDIVKCPHPKVQI